MSSPCQLSGGAFQDSEGNVLANGYLKFRLSQDASVNSSNICAGVEITIQLDGSGNVVSGAEIWGNDVLSPANTFYRVTGYTVKGQRGWGPNNQQVAGSTFDLGTWVPNQIISWTPATGTLLLETNGAPNLSQTLLNLASSDDSVTLTDEGNGTINLQSTGGGTEFSTAGLGWFLGGQSYSPIADNSGGFWPVSGSPVNVVQLILQSKWVISSLRAMCLTGSVGAFTAGIYNAAGTSLLIDAGASAFDMNHSRRVTDVALGSPVTLEPGVYWFAYGAVSGANGSVLCHLVGQWLPDFYDGLSFPSGGPVGPVRFGTAANTLSGGGALPATLGVITAPAEGPNSTNVPAVMFVV